jgi:peptide/nickel transport system permease protein
MTGLAVGEARLGAAATPARPGMARRLLRRLTLLAGLAGLATIVLAGILAPVISPDDPLRQDLTRGLLPPAWAEGGTWAHPFGTDAIGRDVASRLLHGARNSLVIAFFAVLVSSLLGLFAGLSAGFLRGRWEALLMRLGDMQLAFPFILLAIIVLGVQPNRSLPLLVAVLGVPGWILYARVVRSRVLAEREKDYVTAARSLGASPWRQMWRYVLPSVWQVVLVIALLDFGFIILLESTLSFLGFGLAPPTPSWGSILADGRRSMFLSPWLAVLPGLAIMLTVLSVNLVADGAADLLDPKLKRGVFRRVRQRAETAGGGTPGDESAAVERVGPSDEPADPPLLDVRDLRVDFPAEGRVVHAVRGVSLRVERGRTLGVVGESGSGKSVTASAVIGLIDTPGRVTGGRVLFEGRDLTRIPDAEMAALRGRRIGMIFQNPSTALNPVMTIGAQMVETIRLHHRVAADEARRMAEGALLDVGIGDTRHVLSRYPFQLSGGMNQRVMIALAMLARPDLLVADEPTTALDVTTQAQVLDQLRAVTHEHRTALVLISHDIALVREYVDEVVVLYAGQVCESGPVRDVVREPAHPYTQALLASVPRVDLEPGERLAAIPGELPDPAVVPVGCPFAPRCRYAMDVCRETNPPLLPVAPDRMAACHLDVVPPLAPVAGPGAPAAPRVAPGGPGAPTPTVRGAP